MFIFHNTRGKRIAFLHTTHERQNLASSLRARPKPRVVFVVYLTLEVRKKKWRRGRHTLWHIHTTRSKGSRRTTRRENNSNRTTCSNTRTIWTAESARLSFISQLTLALDSRSRILDYVFKYVRLDVDIRYSLEFYAQRQLRTCVSAQTCRGRRTLRLNCGVAGAMLNENPVHTIFQIYSFVTIFINHTYSNLLRISPIIESPTMFGLVFVGEVFNSK